MKRSTASAHGRLALVLVGIFIAALGVLMTAGGQSRRADVAATAAQLPPTARLDANAHADVTPKPEKVEAAGRRDTPKPIASKPSDVPVVAEKHAADMKSGSTKFGSRPAAESVKTASPEPMVKRTAGAEPPSGSPGAEITVKPPAVESTTKADVQSQSPTSITGCLVFDEYTFWLKDASGEDAPKSRSWKWGFLKKRSSSVELVDPSHTLKLPNYVGQRITATGVLSNREMQAHSLQRLATSCN